MYLWEAKLNGRKNAVEFKLAAKRQTWITAQQTRDGLFSGTSSYIFLTERMDRLECEIDELRDELAFVEGLLNIGPVKGGEIALVVRRDASGRKIDVPHSRSLINIIADLAESFRDLDTDTMNKHSAYSEEEALLMAAGLDIARQVILNPYLFLNADERVQYDAIEPEVTKAVERSPTRPGTAQITRDMIEDEPVTRTRKHDQQSRVTSSAPSLVGVDTDDVVVRRR